MTTWWLPARPGRYAEFAERVFARLDMPLQWQGTGVQEKGLMPGPARSSSRSTRSISARRGGPSPGGPDQGKTRLGWEPKVDFDALVNMMVDADWPLPNGTSVPMDKSARIYVAGHRDWSVQPS